MAAAMAIVGIDDDKEVALLQDHWVSGSAGADLTRVVSPEAVAPVEHLLDPMMSPDPEAMRRMRAQQVKTNKTASSDDHHAGAKEPESTVFSSWCVLTNTLLGVGVLGLPFAVSSLGLALGVGLLFAAGLIGATALHFLNEIAIASVRGSQGPAEISFYYVCVKVVPGARYVVDVALCVKCFGVATSYLQVIGQSATALVEELVLPPLGYTVDHQILRACVMSLTLGVVIAPSVFHKRITKTASSNLFAICSWLYITCLVLYYALFRSDIGSHSNWQVLPPDTMTPGVLFSSVPVFIFCFTCHQNLFPIANELKQRTVGRLDTVTFGAVSAALALYFCVGCGGYITYGTNLQANFMAALPHEAPVLFGQVLISIAIVFTYPLQLHPCRRSIMILVQSYMGRYLSRREDRIGRRIVTICILLASLGIAIVIQDLGITLAFVGAVGSNTVVLIMPAFLYMQVFRFEKTAKWYLAAAIFALGCVVLPTSLVSVIKKAMA